MKPKLARGGRKGFSMSDTENARARNVRQRAYFIWQQEGCPDGCADDHWHRAWEMEGEAAIGEAVTGSAEAATASAPADASPTPAPVPVAGKKAAAGGSPAPEKAQAAPAPAKARRKAGRR